MNTAESKLDEVAVVEMSRRPVGTTKKKRWDG